MSGGRTANRRRPTPSSRVGDGEHSAAIATPHRVRPFSSSVLLALRRSDLTQRGASAYISGLTVPLVLFLSIRLCLRISVSLALCFSASLSQSLCPSVSLSLGLSGFLFLRLLVSLSLCLSVFLSLCLSVSLSLCLTVSLSHPKTMCYYIQVALESQSGGKIGRKVQSHPTKAA